MNVLAQTDGYRWLVATNHDGSQYPFLRSNTVVSDQDGLPGDILIGARDENLDGFTVYVGYRGDDVYVKTLEGALAVSKGLLANQEAVAS